MTYRSILVPVTKVSNFDPVEVLEINWQNMKSGASLVIRVHGEGLYRTLRFDGVQGFRVLDERDLESGLGGDSKVHWVNEVESHGWLETEGARPGFILKDFIPAVREYLVLTDNDCISVASTREPFEVELA